MPVLVQPPLPSVVVELVKPPAPTVVVPQSPPTPTVARPPAPEAPPASVPPPEPGVTVRPTELPQAITKRMTAERGAACATSVRTTPLYLSNPHASSLFGHF